MGWSTGGTDSAASVQAVGEGRPFDGTDHFLTLPGFRFYGGGGTLALASGSHYYTPMLLTEGGTVDRLVLSVSATGTATAASLSIHGADAQWEPSSLVIDAGTVAVDSTGIKTKTLSQALDPGRYLLRIQPNGTVTPLAQIYAGLAVLDTWAASGHVRVFRADTGAYDGTAPDPGAAWTEVISGNNGGYALVLPRFSAIG